MSHPTLAQSSARHQIYIPGYAPAKLGLALLGLVLLIASLDKLLPLARLALAGGSAYGEAVRIVKIDAERKEVPYTTDAAVLGAQKAMEEARDFTTFFWVEYRFTTGDGKLVEARSPLGKRVKPLHLLRDADGLPSTAKIWYDKADPHNIALPLEIGTWFLPGMLVLFGVLAMFMGLTLWWHANKPIEMPDLSRSHAEVNGKTT